ncbi:MAG: hypothetical protein DRN17_08530, partial [Thermoplasmata archaeon]
FILAVSLWLLTGCGSDSKPDAGALPPSESGITSSIACFENTEADTAEGKAYVAHCYVHTVDGNSNPVSGYTYNVSLVVERKVSSETGNILTTEPITFSDHTVNFINENVRKTDNLIILPTSTTTDPSYLGNWEISAVATDLTLAESAFTLETTEDLVYVIGTETGYFYDPELGSISASAHIEYPSGDDDPDTGEELEGFFYFDIVYDPALRGAQIVVGAHTFGNRIGAARTLILELEDDIIPPDEDDIIPPDENTIVPPDGSTGTPGECAEGYFWCSIDEKCMPTGDTTSSCS